MNWGAVALVKELRTEPWELSALCNQTDPEVFFPEASLSTVKAKRICASCEVRTQCLEDAMSRDERFGVWGGLSERQRRSLRQARAKAARAAARASKGTA